MRYLRMIAVLLLIALFFSCNLNNEVNVTFKAGAISTAPNPSIMTNVIMSSSLTVTEYNVKLYKIEIGNSEYDKFTLWESSAGQVFNLAGDTPVALSPLNPVNEGTYMFCRITMDKTIVMDGTYNSIDIDPAVTYVINQGNCGLDVEPNRVFLFSSTGVTGNFLLSEAIAITEGAVLTFHANLYGTITESNPPAVSAPVLTLTSH